MAEDLTWREPPIVDLDSLARKQDSSRQVPEVVALVNTSVDSIERSLYTNTVHKPLSCDIESYGRKAIKSVLASVMGFARNLLQSGYPLKHLTLKYPMISWSIW